MARPGFKGNEWIHIQTGDVYGADFVWTTESAAGANDGEIPYGRTISTIVVTATNSAGEDKTSNLISGTPNLVSSTLTVVFKHPGAAGVYKIKCVATLDNGHTQVLTFPRLRAKDY